MRAHGRVRLIPATPRSTQASCSIRARKLCVQKACITHCPPATDEKTLLLLAALAAAAADRILSRQSYCWPRSNISPTPAVVHEESVRYGSARADHRSPGTTYTRATTRRNDGRASEHCQVRFTLHLSVGPDNYQVLLLPVVAAPTACTPSAVLRSRRYRRRGQWTAAQRGIESNASSSISHSPALKARHTDSATSPLGAALNR